MLENKSIARGTCGENVAWKLNAGVLTVSGNGPMNESWSRTRSKLRDTVESIVIEDGVTGICDDAFAYCENLKEIIIPDSVTHIGKYAFWDCVRLRDVVIPSGVKEIGTGAFAACSLRSEAWLRHIANETEGGKDQ